MGNHGCDTDGKLISDNFTGALPAIGVYIAVASLLIFFFMLFDLVSGLRSKKPWFPCKIFSLNSASLTLLTIATKLSVDLNTPMPSRIEQLSKLSSTVLICTVMANFMPSLGHMGQSELISNVIAVAILVITVIVNICIQIATGAIYVYLPEHAITMFLMLVLLVLLCFSALAVPITRGIFNAKIRTKWTPEVTDHYVRHSLGTRRYEVMIEEVKKWWLMACSSSQNHVLSSLDTCNVGGAFSLISALVLVQAVVRSVFMGFCNGGSDYRWSIWGVLVFQVLGVVVGNVAPLCRWLNVVNRSDWSFSEKFLVEHYCFQSLEEWKSASLPFTIGNMKCRAVVLGLKGFILDIVMGMHIVVIWVSKVIRLSPLMAKRSLVSFGLHNNELPIAGSADQSQLGNLRNHVIHPNQEPTLGDEGETLKERVEDHDLVPFIFKIGVKDIQECISNSERSRPTHLIELLQRKSGDLRGFRTVFEVDRDHFPSAPCLAGKNYVSTAVTGGTEWYYDIPPNCMALPVVTLTSIAISVMQSDKDRLKSLLQGVRQGLKFVNYIEKALETKQTTKMVIAAREVWMSIDLHNRWLDVSLCDLASTYGSLETRFPEEIIQALEEIGRKRYVPKHEERIIKDHPDRWPVDVPTGNCLHRVCEAILRNRDRFPTKKELVDWLEQTISDLLCDWLVDLPLFITRGFSNYPSIEDGEKRVRNAACILWEAQHLQEALYSPLSTQGELFADYVQRSASPMICRRCDSPSSITCRRCGSAGLIICRRCEFHA